MALLRSVSRPLLFCCSLLALPARAQQPSPEVHGLTATYYRGAHFETKVLTRTDAVISFDWDGTAPGAGVPISDFSVRWEGFLSAPKTGVYTLVFSADDGVRLWLGGKLLLDEWRPQPPTQFRVVVKLTAGQPYPLRVEYYQLDYQSRAQLSWIPPDAPKASGLNNLFGLLDDDPPKPTPIPASALLVRLPEVSVTPTPPVAATPPSRPVVAPVAPPRRISVPVVPPIKPSPPVVRKPVPTPTSAPPPTVATLGTAARGTTLALPNLYFEQGKPRLLIGSAETLDALTAALRAQPALQLEIGGHTDNQGDPVLNQRLSEQRARRVREYLTQRGIDSARLTAVGYGGTRPIADNADAGQRARNRRVEVTVR